MRSVRLLRNDNVTRLIKPFLESTWSQKHTRNTLTTKKYEEQIGKKDEDSDPYEGNYRFDDCDHYTKVSCCTIFLTSAEKNIFSKTMS